MIRYNFPSTFIRLCGLIAIVVLLSGCGRQIANDRSKQQPRQPVKKLVGFSQMEHTGPWRVAETESMKAEAAKRGYELIVTDAGGDTAKQVKDVQDLVARGVEAIFLAPREYDGFAPAFEAASGADIPVFLLDREAAGQIGKDFVAFIGSNFREEGRRVGDWVAKNSHGRAGIVILEGNRGSSVARDRNEGFMEAIASSPDIRVLASVPADFIRMEGQKRMEELIKQFGKSITAVYAHNDEMALGAIDALKAARMAPGKNVLVVSVDGQRSALQAILAGEMNVTMECNPKFGPIAFDTYERYLRGEGIAPKVIVPDRFFDHSNAAQFLDDTY